MSVVVIVDYNTGEKVFSGDPESGAAANALKPGTVFAVDKEELFAEIEAQKLAQEAVKAPPLRNHIYRELFSKWGRQAFTCSKAAILGV